jgi:hypothetical protein
LEFGPLGRPEERDRRTNFSCLADRREVERLKLEIDKLELLLVLDNDPGDEWDALTNQLWLLFDRMGGDAQIQFAFQIYDRFRVQLDVADFDRGSVWLQFRLTEQEASRLQAMTENTVRKCKSEIVVDWIERGLGSVDKPRFPRKNGSLSTKVCVRCPWATANALKKRARILGVTPSKLIRSYIVRGLRNCLPKLISESGNGGSY